jgi:hypothetical protein
MAYVDNGDGTITVNGFKIAKPFGMKQPNQMAPPAPTPMSPELTAAAAPGPDMRSAESASFEVPGLSMPGGKPFQPKSVLDAGRAPPPPPPPTDPRTAAIVDGLRKSGSAPMTMPSEPEAAPPPEMRGPTARARGGDGLMGPSMPAMAGPRVIDPGGMRKVAESTQMGVPIPQELRDQREGATLSARAANMAGYEAQSEEQRQMSVEMRAQADEQQRQLGEEKQRQVTHRETLAAAQQKLESMQADYRSKPINEDAYWQEQGRGAKMAAGIWVAMGQLAQRMGGQGTENVAKSMIDKQVDSWVADNKERRAGAIQGQQTAVANTRQNFESETAQSAALRAQAYDAYRAKLGAIVGENAPEKLKAQAAALDADLQQKSADWAIQAAQAEADHVTTQSRLVGPTVAGGGAGDVDPEMYVQSAGGFALRKDAPPKMNEQFLGLNKLEQLTKQLKMKGETVDQRADPAARAELESLSGQWIVAYKEAKGMGALDKGTQEVGESIIGNPKALLGIGRDRVLGGVMNGIASDRRNLQSTYGITPGNVVVVPDGKGGHKRVGVFTGQHGAQAPQQNYDFQRAGGR